MSTRYSVAGAFVRQGCFPSPITALATAVLLVLAHPSFAQSSASPSRDVADAQALDFDIPAAPLGQSLLAIAQHSGLVISADPALVADRHAPAVRGRYTAELAARLALAGQPLALTRNANGVWTLAPAALAVTPTSATRSTTLSEVRVTAQAMPDGDITEGSGSYTTRSVSTATRLNLSLRETPQSVSVLTRQQIEDQGIQTIEDVAQQTTGLTLSRGAPERAQLRARGFAIDTILVDGLPMNYDSDVTGSGSLAMYDHVEVLRGAAGLLQGTGNPSGTLNLKRKRATDETEVALTGSVGRWNNYRAELDAGGPLNEARTLRGRTVIARQDTDSFRDHYSNDRRLVYGTLDADISRDTTLSVGASYSREVNNGSAWYGVPTYRDGTFLPISRSSNFTPGWAYWNKKNVRVFTDLEHRWDNGWNAKLSAYANNSDMTALYNSLARVSGSENLRFGFVGDSRYAERMRGVDLNATGPFSLLGRRHELVVGASYRNYYLYDTGKMASGYNFSVAPEQPWLIETAPYPNLGATWGVDRYRTKQTGAYLTSRLNVSDPLKLILGSRLDWFDYSVVDGQGYAVDRKFTPYAGLVYELNRNYSAYASWTRIFKPQNYRARNGDILAPVTGVNYEAGIKGEFFDGALNTTAAVFKIVQNNLPKSLDSDQCAPGMRSCAEPAGEVESKGVELEVAGRLARNWQVSAGYTYTSAKYSKAADAADEGARFASDQPRHLVKLTTSYRLTGPFEAWRVGSTVRLQNEIDKDTSGVRIRQGGYALLDLMAGWQASRNLDLRLNVYNVFDKYYYESIGSPINGNGFGSPRSWLLTAKYQF